jgi:hypothetical protein
MGMMPTVCAAFAVGAGLLSGGEKIDAKMIVTGRPS